MWGEVGRGRSVHLLSTDVGHEKKRGGERTLEKQTTHSNEQSHTGNCSVTCSCELILLYYTESGSIGHSFRGKSM